MTRRRWIADEFSPDHAALTGEHAAHLSRTLRVRVGQQFEVACGQQVHRATVAAVANDRVEFVLGEEIQARPVVPITLLVAIFKFDRMEWAIEKCTELNVTNIMPVIARRTEKHLAIAASKRVERWRRIAREASEQSRRIMPPEIAGPVKLKDALELVRLRGMPPGPSADESDGERPMGSPHEVELREMLSESLQRSLPLGSEPRRGEIGSRPGREPWVSPPINPGPVGTAQSSEALVHPRIVLSEAEREAGLNEILRSQTEDVESLALAVGPEGGWVEDELQSFASSRWIAASLGETILRAETAAIAAVAIARAEI